jgi:hypothetical protein
MPTPRETILAALHERLQTLAAPVLRGEVLPERIPANGLIILRDGKPGEPEVTLSPLTYFYEHRAGRVMRLGRGGSARTHRSAHRWRGFPESGGDHHRVALRHN